MSPPGRVDVAEQLRLRRQASDRMAPMDDGRRDPLDPEPRGKFRPASIVVDDGRRVFLVRGHEVAEVLRRFGLKPIWSQAGRGHVVDAKHLPDVAALLEHAGYSVRVREREAA